MTPQACPATAGTSWRVVRQVVVAMRGLARRVRESLGAQRLCQRLRYGTNSALRRLHME